jgi:hypothetical protein
VLSLWGGLCSGLVPSLLMRGLGGRELSPSPRIIVSLASGKGDNGERKKLTPWAETKWLRCPSPKTPKINVRRDPGTTRMTPIRSCHLGALDRNCMRPDMTATFRAVFSRIMAGRAKT